MDPVATFSLSSSRLSSSPSSSPSSSFSFSHSNLSSPRFSPHSPSPISPPLTPTVRASCSISLASPRTSYPRSSSFQRFDDSFRGSFKKFDLAFNGSFKRNLNKENRSPGSATAHAGCATEPKEEVPNGMAGFGNIRKTYYSLLGVPQVASQKEIRLAYRKLALQYHPDVVPLHRLDSTTKLFSQVNEAYDTLSDPQKRKYYDLQQALKAPASVGAGYGSTRKYTNMANGGVYPSMNAFYREWKGTRNWETDQCWC